MKYYGVKLKKNDKRYKKYAKQRKNRGFDDSETWNLDYTIAKFIVPRLKVFASKIYSYPPNLTPEKWKEILQEMIDGFEIHLDEPLIHSNFDDKIYKKFCKERYRKTLKSLTLFKKYFWDLWN